MPYHASPGGWRRSLYEPAEQPEAAIDPATFQKVEGAGLRLLAAIQSRNAEEVERLIFPDLFQGDARRIYTRDEAVSALLGAPAGTETERLRGWRTLASTDADLEVTPSGTDDPAVFRVTIRDRSHEVFGLRRGQGTGKNRASGTVRLAPDIGFTALE